jgi:GT2 family glycosyltransferase
MSVTVVIPCYNAEEHLRDALRSVRAQARPAHEVIVVDDGSTDGSAALARTEGARIVRTAGRVGPGAARNVGLEAVQTPLVAFLDADDFWLPDHLERVAPLVERSPEVAVAWSRVEKFGNLVVGAPSVTILAPAVDCPVEAPFDALPLLIERNIVSQSSVVARREALLGAGGYDPSFRFSEDYDLWARVSAAGWRFAYTPRVTCRYRVHPAQATAASSADAVVAGTSWRVRTRLERQLTSTRRAALLPPVEERLRLLYAGELRRAWRAADPAWLRTLLDASPQVPGGTEVANGWRARATWMPLWVALHRTLRIARGVFRPTGSVVRSRRARVIPTSDGAEPPA